MIYGIDATTTWDTPVIQMVGDPSFPILGGLAPHDGNVVYKYFNNTDGDIDEIRFNWTNAEGVDASGDKAEVITFTIHVADNAEPGIYYINTRIKTLEGPEEDKQIFEGTDVKQPPVERDGELDGQPGQKQTDTYTVDGEQSYTKDSMQEKTFTVKADKDPKKAFDKFRSLWIDNGDGTYTLVSFDNYTASADDNGALQITLKPDYLQTLAIGDHNFKFVFSDGETVGTLHVVEAETATPETTSGETTPGKSATDGSTDDSSAPAATTKGSSSTTDTASSTNGAAVQTGSPEAAIIFVVLLVMAAGIIIFNKKRRKDN